MGNKKYRNYKELDENEIKKLTKDYLNGKSQMFLSNKYNLYYRGIIEILKNNGIKIKTKEDYRIRNKKIIDKKEDIVKMYKENLLSPKEIASVLKTSKSTIERILKKSNILMNSSERKKLLFNKKKLIPYNKITFTENQINKIVSLYKDDYLDPPKICPKFNLSSPQIIIKILKERGVYQNIGERKKMLFKAGKLKSWCKGLKGDIRLKSKFKKHFTDEQIKEIANLYTIKFLDSEKIGKIFNCSPMIILRVLNEQGINTTLSHRKKDLFKNNILIPYVRTEKHKQKMKEYKTGNNFFINKTWEELYGEERAKELKEKMRMRMIKRNLENPIIVSEETKEKNRKRLLGKTYEELYGIEKSEELKKKIARPLEKNGRWLGGKSFEPYDLKFNNKFKRAIRKRDNHECLKCGIHQEKLSRTLTVHHINYDKKITLPQNCCSLCLRCNSEVNSNRPHWIKFFQSLLSERYDYKYSETGEIIIKILKEKF